MTRRSQQDLRAELERLEEYREVIQQRIAAVRDALAPLELMDVFRRIPWEAQSAEHLREVVAYSVPVSLRAEVLELVPERLRAAMQSGFDDADARRS